MAGTHRTSPRRIARRRATLAAGAFVATSAIAFAPAAQGAAATTVDPLQTAENSYTTYDNLLKIGNNLGRTQQAVTNPIAKIAPNGWLPTTSNDYANPDPETMNFFAALGKGVSMVASPMDTGHVPGIPGLAVAGTLPAQLLTGAPLLLGADGQSVVADGAVANLKIAGAWGLLNGINTLALAGNSTAPVAGAALDLVGSNGFKVIQNAEQIKFASLEEALKFFPEGTYTSSAWNSGFAWPVVMVSGNTWGTQERLQVDGITTDELKQKFQDSIKPANYDPDVPGSEVIDPLKVQYGDTVNVWGEKKVCTIFGCTMVPVIVGQKWEPKLGPDGKPIEKVYVDPITGLAVDPAAQIPGALSVLDGIDFSGFSITKRTAGGDYRVLDGRLGWASQTTQVMVPGKNGGPATVATNPVVAGGLALPFQLFEIGGLYTPGVVTQSGQSVNSTLGSRSFGLAIPRLGVGIDTTSLFESSHIGPDGIAFNSGWTVALINGGPVPIPLIYSLGSFNIGPKGIGYTSPSFFGVGLPDFQLGTNVGTTGTGNALGDIQLPTSFIRLDPKLLFSMLNIQDPTGLGLTDPFGTAQSVLSPLYTQLVTPIATPVWQAGADLGGQVTNVVSDQGPKVTGQLVTGTDKIADGTEQVSEKVEPTIPDLPDNKLDNTTIQPGLDGITTSLDELQAGFEKIGDDIKGGFGSLKDSPSGTQPAAPQSDTPQSDAPQSEGAITGVN